MRFTKYFSQLAAVMLVGSLALSACAGFGPEATPEPELFPIEPFAPIVSATGIVVPQESATLSMTTAGILGELMVEEGSQVAAGEVLGRLELQQPLESYQAAVTAANLELASANQALDDLYENASLLAAIAQKEVTQAQDDLKEADRKRNNLNYDRASEASIDAAEANYILAQDEVDKAQKAFNKVDGRRAEDPVRALALSNLSAAKQRRDSALRTLNWYKGNPSDLEISQADADLVLAQAQLDDALRRLENLSDGPDPDQVALAEARIDNAEAQLAAAEAALAELEVDLTLQAPFAGTVAELYIHSSEWVTPGQPLMLLADLGRLHIETTDLNEIDVAQVQVGDTATITFDALPELSLQGTVTHIAPKAATGAGVNYTVELELPDIPDELRWGMTAFVDIEIDD
jgi:multidrug efflux pump subunit AcrA (membrane-fusion protein)